MISTYPSLNHSISGTEKNHSEVLVEDSEWFTSTCRVDEHHRRDSTQGTDYIANDFFLNFRISRTKI